MWFKGRTIICGVISPGSIPGIHPYNMEPGHESKNSIIFNIIY